MNIAKLILTVLGQKEVFVSDGLRCSTVVTSIDIASELSGFSHSKPHYSRCSIYTMMSAYSQSSSSHFGDDSAALGVAEGFTS